LLAYNTTAVGERTLSGSKNEQLQRDATRAHYANSADLNGGGGAG
jgi:hypothetical protein